MTTNRFITVAPEYTSGGVYVFSGKLTDGNYFIASAVIFTELIDVRIVNADPDEPTVVGTDGTVWERTADSVEWQEAHLVADLDLAETATFFGEMLTWITSHKPTGNYTLKDMKLIGEEVETLRRNCK